MKVRKVTFYSIDWNDDEWDKRCAGIEGTSSSLTFEVNGGYLDKVGTVEEVDVDIDDDHILNRLDCPVSEFEKLFGNKSQIFVDHIKDHLNNPDSVVMCMICKKTIDQIYDEEKGVEE